MKLTFIGKQTPLTAPQQRKMEARLAKLSKMLDRRGQTSAVAVLSVERHLHKTAITLRYYDQALVGSGANTDQFASLMDAIENLEIQIIRFRAKRRDTRRVAPEPALAVAKPAPSKSARSKPAKVVRAAAKGNGKPMTVEEAVLTMEAEQDYVVYRDAETGNTSVLVRRRDGKLDLIEA